MEEDYPDTDDVQWRARQFMELEDAEYADRLAEYPDTPDNPFECPFSMFD